MIVFKIDNDGGFGMEIIEGLRFFFENYKFEVWYWELVEMLCKVVFIFGVIFVG